jgi:hypothetical protein
MVADASLMLEALYTREFLGWRGYRTVPKGVLVAPSSR